MSSPNHPREQTAEPLELQATSQAVPADRTPLLHAGYSLRFELLISQLTILALVIAGFGGSISILVRQATYRQAESDLLGAAQLLAQDVKSSGVQAPLAIDQAYRHRFGPAPRDHAYFVVWNAAGTQIAGTDPLPPHVVFPIQPPPASGKRPFLFQSHGTHLDVIVRGPDQTLLLVGRPLAKEFDHLQRLLVTVILFGLLSLLIGAIAAWWVARRIVQPLERLTSTAEQITVKNLDQRLEVVNTSAEVRRLSVVFNTMLERLQSSFQRQIRFTADASHELRTPVAVILSQAEQTLTRPRDAEHYCAALETCLKAARRMKRLVDDLLLLARADSGRLQLRHEPFDLAEVTRQTLALLKPLATEKGIHISAQLLTTLVVGDAPRLGQVLTNLLTNAIQYNRPAGEIFVTVNVNTTDAVLRVSDTGIGIPQADLPRLFERFFRADEARTHLEGQGTGLGLSIASEIIASHGGTIDVTSEAGVGTTVTVHLPVAGPAQ
jgi:two-component system OmpR family sensor kinase